MSSHPNLLNSSYHSYYFKISAERYEQYTDSQCHRHRWSHGAIPWSSKHKWGLTNSDPPPWLCLWVHHWTWNINIKVYNDSYSATKKLVIFITVQFLDHISGGSSSSGGCRYQHNFATNMFNWNRLHSTCTYTYTQLPSSTSLVPRRWRVGLHTRSRLRQHVAIQSTCGQHAYKALWPSRSALSPLEFTVFLPIIWKDYCHLWELPGSVVHSMALALLRGFTTRLVSMLCTAIHAIKHWRPRK